MKKFKFVFASVLELKRRQEKKTLAALAESQMRFKLEVEKKQILQRTLQEALIRREAFAHGVEANPISIMHTEQDFIVGTKQRLIGADQAILRARRNLEKTLRTYLLAKKETRSIESLYEKAYQEFRRALVKREMKEEQDLSIMRARFNSGGIF